MHMQAGAMAWHTCIIISHKRKVQAQGQARLHGNLAPTKSAQAHLHRAKTTSCRRRADARLDGDLAPAEDAQVHAPVRAPPDQPPQQQLRKRSGVHAVCGCRCTAKPASSLKSRLQQLFSRIVCYRKVDTLSSHYWQLVSVQTTREGWHGAGVAKWGASMVVQRAARAARGDEQQLERVG